MSKEEALSLFSKEQVLMRLEQNSEERDHLMYVIAVAAGRTIAEARPVALKLKQFLPTHHDHKNSDRKTSHHFSTW